ncbi:MAG: hypothetical protein ACI92G_000806 [Candidatus Pelagisphaera sp.]
MAGVLYRYRIKEEEAALNELPKLGIPMVMLNSPLDSIPSVNANFLSGTIEAIQHLKELGRTNIAYIKANPKLPAANERFTAFKKALTHCELELQSNLLAEADFGYDTARIETLELLRKEPSINAIICCSDRAAMGAIHAAKQLGARIPDDIAIISLGNLPEIQELSDHPLTTIADSLYVEAYRATTKLIDIINNRDNEPHTEFIDTRLIKRQTTLGSNYRAPSLDVCLSAENGSLDYLLSVGASLDRYSRARLQKQIGNVKDTDPEALSKCESIILEAVRLGYDANLAHDIIRKLTTKSEQLANNPKKLSSIEDKLYEISCN